jgi:hypothetical protein
MSDEPTRAEKRAFVEAMLAKAADLGLFEVCSVNEHGHVRYRGTDAGPRTEELWAALDAWMERQP